MLRGASRRPRAAHFDRIPHELSVNSLVSTKSNYRRE